MSSDNEIKYDNSDVGRLITKIRNEKGYSTYRLAIDSGVSSGVIIRIEKGEREPKINTLLKILNGLDITPSDFFSRLD